MFYITQAGSALQIVDTSGAITTLTLPSGVSIDATLRGRFAILAQQILFSRAGTVSLWIDPADLTVRQMHIPPPIAAPQVAAGSSTGLTGAYRTKVSFAYKNEDGAILNESPLSGRSAEVTLANEDLSLTQIPISPLAYVNCRRIYRTVAGGSVYFRAFDIDDNSTEAIANALSDAALELLPEDPTLGNPAGAYPGTRMELLTAWKSRLWGKGSAPDERDLVRYTEIDRFYAWGSSNQLKAHPAGEDEYGITAFAARRDELGILKRNRVLKVIGSGPEDFEVIIVAEGVGCLASESVAIIRDVAYFLGLDGVYTFGPQGITPISHDKVKPWFTTDTYFNRAQFEHAFGGWNHQTDTYDLHLAAANSSDIDRWVSYDPRRKEWSGIHRTSKFTPSARAMLRASDGSNLPTIGSEDGYLYKMNQTGASDGGDTAIAIDWITKWLSGGAPDIFHFWDQPTIFSKIQAAGTLVVTPRVGNLDANNGTAQNVDMTKDRNRLPRWGVGRLLRLQFTHSTDAQDVELIGIEQPFNEVGRR